MNRCRFQLGGITMGQRAEYYIDCGQHLAVGFDRFGNWIGATWQPRSCGRSR
jgi:hypothetical protein